MSEEKKSSKPQARPDDPIGRATSDKKENNEHSSPDSKRDSGQQPGQNTKQRETTDDKQETQNMEVQKHPHHVTHKKKWGEYLLEFLMLFLAVFLGFIAENIRENAVNREIEKNNVERLIKNLQEDSLLLIRSIAVNEKRFKYLDSLIYLKRSNVDESFQEQFIYYMLKLGYLDYFTSNQSTFKQMQSSGTLRLIKHSNVLDSILKYETNYERIKHQEDLCAVWWNKAIEQVSSIVDLTPLAHLPSNTLWDITKGDLNAIELPNVSKDQSNLQAYYNWRVNERISLGYYNQYLHDQVSYIRTLIPFLKKEYHLE